MMRTQQLERILTRCKNITLFPQPRNEVAVAQLHDATQRVRVPARLERRLLHDRARGAVAEVRDQEGVALLQLQRHPLPWSFANATWLQDVR